MFRAVDYNIQGHCRFRCHCFGKPDLLIVKYLYCKHNKLYRYLLYINIITSKRHVDIHHLVPSGIDPRYLGAPCPFMMNKEKTPGVGDLYLPVLRKSRVTRRGPGT
jgi:hypothetical protein